ncbi:MAG: pilus assembly protein N-terminal domain-containing protein [Hyphomicrobiales bacterium]
MLPARASQPFPADAARSTAAGRRRGVASHPSFINCNGTFTNGEANWPEVENSSLTHKAGVPAKDTTTMIIKKSLTAILLCAALFAAHQASAAEPLVLLTDQTQILTLPRPAGTIVVGNPTFADVTVQGKRVFLHGRAFGTTNIIIMDESGSHMADYEVTVMMGGSKNLALYKGGSRYSYVCAPSCEATLQVGDPTDWLAQEIASGITTKTNLATGKAAVETPQTGNSGNSEDSGSQQ